MQNIINTIKYTISTVVFAIVFVGFIAIPAVTKADEGWDYSPSYDYYDDSSSWSYSPSYDYYEDSSWDYAPSYDYYDDNSYASSWDYYPSYDYYDDSSSWDYSPSYDYYDDSYYAYSPSYDYYDDSYYAYDNDYYEYEETYYAYDNYGYQSGYQPSYQGYGGGYNYGSSGCGSNCNTRPPTGCTSNCNTRPPIVDNTQPLNGSCPTSGTYNINQNINWYANASGGTGSYTYTWSGDVSGSGSSISRSYNSTGTKRATVVIRSGTQSITRDCSVQIENRNNNNDDLEAICIVSDTRVEEGDRVTFEVEIDGGERPYDIEWRGDIDGDDEEVTERFDDEGRYHVSVRVTDDNGRSVFDDCAVVVVGDDEDEDDDSNITLISSGTNPPPTGTLASGVFLSEIPYTGVAENLKMILFVLGMTLWSAFMAWVIMKRKASKLGMTQKEMIEKFKKENLLKKGITA